MAPGIDFARLEQMVRAKGQTGLILAMDRLVDLDRDEDRLGALKKIIEQAAQAPAKQPTSKSGESA